MLPHVTVKVRIQDNVCSCKCVRNIHRLLMLTFICLPTFIPPTTHLGARICTELLWYPKLALPIPPNSAWVYVEVIRGCRWKCSADPRGQDERPGPLLLAVLEGEIKGPGIKSPDRSQENWGKTELHKSLCIPWTFAQFG